MPTILTYFDDPGADDYPFDDVRYKNSYAELGAAVVRAGGDFYVVRSPDTYKGRMTFASGWKYVNGEFRDVASPIKGQLIYNKGRQLRTGSRDKVLNPAGLDAACGMDKHRTFEVFPEHFPATVEVDPSDDLATAVNAMKTDAVVIKPVEGFGGHGVFIGSKEEALRKHYDKAVVVQEFVDTSGGIPGITSGHHDLRLLIMDGKIFMTFLRTPPKGKLISNVALGGQMSIVPQERWPREMEDIVADIDGKLTVFEHRMYTIDCGKDVSGEWYVFELNDQPGLLFTEECGSFKDSYFDGLGRYLMECAEA